MIKNRSFMFGLGTGLIAGALLLQLMISGGAAPLTKEELVREAAKLNLTVTDPAAELQGSTEQTGEAGAPEGNEASSSPSSSPSPAASPQAVAQPSNAAAPSEPAVPSQPVQSAGTAAAPETPATPQAAESGAVAVHIPAGSTLTEAAQLLVQAGVVQDQSEFLQTAISRKINAKIQYGSYNFTKGESVNSIIDKLTKVK